MFKKLYQTWYSHFGYTMHIKLWLAHSYETSIGKTFCLFKKKTVQQCNKKTLMIK